MALKPFYNKKGHLGMTRAELLEKLNGGGLNTFSLTLTFDQVENMWASPFKLTITNHPDFDDLFAADVILLTVPAVPETVPELKVYLYKQVDFGDDFIGVPAKLWQAFCVPVIGDGTLDTFNVTIGAENDATTKIKISVTKVTVTAGNSLNDLI